MNHASEIRLDFEPPEDDEEQEDDAMARDLELDKALRIYLEREASEPSRRETYTAISDLHRLVEKIADAQTAHLQEAAKNLADINARLGSLDRRVTSLEDSDQEDTDRYILRLEEQAAMKSAKADELRSRRDSERVKALEGTLSHGMKIAIAVVAFVFSALVGVIAWLAKLALGHG